MNGHSLNSQAYVTGNPPCVQSTLKYQKNRSVLGHMYERKGPDSRLLGRSNIAGRA